jgi:elongation factor G
MVYDAKNIRNVVLLGHSGSGKTSFVECMLYEAKAIPRRGKIEDGNTVSDFTQIEQARGNSIFSTLMHVGWKDCKINIIDTPGSDDFVGEVVSALKVADTSIMLLNAKHGVEVGTELVWEYVQNFHTPTIFVINQLDHEKADFESTLDQAKARFGDKVLAVQYPLPMGSGQVSISGGFDTIIDALRMVMYKFPSSGGKPEKHPIPSGEMSRAEAMHQALVEAAAENDETLMEMFFENGTLTEEELSKGLTIALANQQIYPVFCASAVKNMGSGRIMGFIHDICPSPADRPEGPLSIGGSLSDKTSIFIYKTMSEPNVGNVSYFKVYSGMLNSGDDLVNADNSTVERFNQMFLANGKNRELANCLKAGDIGVTVKLKNSHTNNTLNIKGNDVKIKEIDFPAPRIRTAVAPPSKNDVEKLARALHTIQEEDPTLLVEQSIELKQMILHGQGQLHLDMVKYRLEKMYGVNVNFIKPKIPYRETITRTANHSYRHKKQSGGAGQFAEVHMRIEPFYEGMAAPAGLNVRSTDEEILTWGGKFVFLNCIVGGVVDTRFMSAIKKGIMSKMTEGPLTGSYVRDVRVSLYDGKMHDVDSNDMAFMVASTQCFREAFPLTAPQIMEPIYDLEVLCDSEMMGEIMGDLQTRRAVIMGMDADGHYQKIMARVPLAELHNYSSTLRSLTQGKAKFKSKFAEYQSVPGDVQARLIEEHKHELQEEHA